MPVEQRDMTAVRSTPAAPPARRKGVRSESECPHGDSDRETCDDDYGTDSQPPPPLWSDRWKTAVELRVWLFGHEVILQSPRRRRQSRCPTRSECRDRA